MHIIEHLRPIIQTIKNNPVSVIVAPTGSGKSTIIPGSLARLNKRSRESRRGNRNPKADRVMVSVPTRAAARSLRMYTQSQFQDIKIGMAAEGQVEYDDNTDLIYVTSGHLKRKLLSALSIRTGGSDRVGPTGRAGRRDVNFAGIIIVDESHTGTVDNTVIISLWMYAASQNLQVPRLVLISATPTPMKITPEPAYYDVTIPHTHPVQIIYQNGGKKLPNERQILTQAQNVVQKIVSGSTNPTGAILIFVPGSKEVESMIRDLKKKVGTKAIITGAYSAMEQKDLDLIYSTPPEGKWKIIVATNIAESSITIEDLYVVVDTLLEKQSGSTKSGGKSLSTGFISQDSADQRRGRVGRTQEGICYRLLSKEQYENLDKHKISEIERVPIHETVMSLLAIGLDPLTVIKGISVSKVKQSMTILSSLKMISADGKVSPMGQFSTRVPLNINNAAFLYHWINEGLPLFPGVVTASIIDAYGPSYFFIPRKEPDQSAEEYRIFLSKYTYEISQPFLGENEVQTYLNLWLDFTSIMGAELIPIIERGRISPGNHKIFGRWKEWTSDNKVNAKKFKELISLISLVYRACVKYIEANELSNNTKVGGFRSERVIERAKDFLLESYPMGVMKKISGSGYQNISSGMSYTYDTRTPLSLTEQNVDLPANILALNTFQIVSSRGGDMNIISLALDLLLSVPSVPTFKLDNVLPSRTDEASEVGSSSAASSSSASSSTDSLKMSTSRRGGSTSRGRGSITRPRNTDVTESRRRDSIEPRIEARTDTQRGRGSRQRYSRGSDRNRN